ncbi:MAG: 3-hydroxybutyrate oligomer hydrolase family protein [Burkholderiales bacterium]
MRKLTRRWRAIVLATGSVALAACNGDGGGSPSDLNTLPAGVTNIVGPANYDGVTDDLLTGGLGKTGLAGAAPGFADAQNPTAAELRRRVIYTNYRAVLDISAAGGFGILYGPNIDVNGNDTLGEGKIAGREILAYVDDGSGRKNVTVMVQIPASFNPQRPCIVAAPSSGSRGVYGAIGSAGEWGLKHKCAVAYTDAGKGMGYQDLQADKVNLIDGRLVARSSVAASLVSFASDLTGAALSAFNAAFPNRVAYKHVYSQQNPEKDWGKNVLDSIRFAFWALNEQYGTLDATTGRRIKTITPDNTTVIASSISNGGSESLQALEQDTEGLIDALAVAEPNAQPASMTGVTVNFGGSSVPNAGKPLVDYFSYRVLYEPCASLSTKAQAPNGVRPGWFGGGTATGALLGQVGGQDLNAIATNRCQSLADKGLITGTTLAERADAALAKLQAYGWTDPLSNALHASHYRAADQYVASGYATAYGKFSVADNLCGFSLANFDGAGAPAAQVPATQASIFSTANGLGGNGGVDVIYNDSVGGARMYLIGTSASTGRADGALDGQLCVRNMVTGVDAVTGAALTGAALANSQRVQAGARDVLLTGNLRGRPAVIVHGRSDTLVPVNHSSRAYVAYNSKVEASSNLRYYEIENGQHFDAFVPSLAAGAGINGYDVLFVPVHYYFINAMDIVWARLEGNVPMPPSQVVRTTPRGGTPGAAPQITVANVPKIGTPTAANAITASGGTINVPN